MATSIRLAPETERRLDYLASWSIFPEVSQSIFSGGISYEFRKRNQKTAKAGLG